MFKKSSIFMLSVLSTMSNLTASENLFPSNKYNYDNFYTDGYPIEEQADYDYFPYENNIKLHDNNNDLKNNNDEGEKEINNNLQSNDNINNHKDNQVNNNEQSNNNIKDERINQSNLRDNNIINNNGKNLRNISDTNSNENNNNSISTNKNNNLNKRDEFNKFLMDNQNLSTIKIIDKVANVLPTNNITDKHITKFSHENLHEYFDIIQKSWNYLNNSIKNNTDNFYGAMFFTNLLIDCSRTFYTYNSNDSNLYTMNIQLFQILKKASFKIDNYNHVNNKEKHLYILYKNILKDISHLKLLDRHNNFIKNFYSIFDLNHNEYNIIDILISLQNIYGQYENYISAEVDKNVTEDNKSLDDILNELQNTSTNKRNKKNKRKNKTDVVEEKKVEAIKELEEDLYKKFKEFYNRKNEINEKITQNNNKKHELENKLKKLDEQINNNNKQIQNIKNKLDLLRNKVTNNESISNKKKEKKSKKLKRNTTQCTNNKNKVNNYHKISQNEDNQSNISNNCKTPDDQSKMNNNYKMSQSINDKNINNNYKIPQCIYNKKKAKNNYKIPNSQKKISNDYEEKSTPQGEIDNNQNNLINNSVQKEIDTKQRELEGLYKESNEIIDEKDKIYRQIKCIETSALKSLKKYEKVTLEQIFEIENKVNDKNLIAKWIDEIEKSENNKK